MCPTSNPLRSCHNHDPETQEKMENVFCPCEELVSKIKNQCGVTNVKQEKKDDPQGSRTHIMI